MSDTSTNVLRSSHDSSGKFAKGNKLGAGYTGNAIELVLRDRAIKFFREEPGRGVPPDPRGDRHQPRGGGLDAGGGG
jgi:hypothetical protein